MYAIVEIQGQQFRAEQGKKLYVHYLGDERKDRCAAGTSMPGHALFLWDIEYPFSF